MEVTVAIGIILRMVHDTFLVWSHLVLLPPTLGFRVISRYCWPWCLLVEEGEKRGNSREGIDESVLPYVQLRLG